MTHEGLFNQISSAAYTRCRNELDRVYRSLSALAHRDSWYSRVAALLQRRDSLKAQLKALNESYLSHSYRDWNRDLSKKSAPEWLKLINHPIRRRLAAGASLSSSPPALESYRNHFRTQCTNDFDLLPNNPPTIPVSDFSGLLEFSDTVFDDSNVQLFVCKSSSVTNV